MCGTRGTRVDPSVLAYEADTLPTKLPRPVSSDDNPTTVLHVNELILRNDAVQRNFQH